MVELSRLLTVNSGLHVTCIPLMVSPPLPTFNVHCLHLRSQRGKRLDVDPRLICQAFNPKGQREKVGRELHTLLSLPRR